MQTPSLTADDLADLSHHLLDRDSDSVVDWMQSHVTSPRDMFGLIIAVSSLIGSLFPIGITAGIELDHGAGDMWALDASRATPSGRAVGQIITASLNDDHDQVYALAMAALHPAEHAADVIAGLLGALADALNAIVDVAKAEGASRRKEDDR